MISVSILCLPALRQLLEEYSESGFTDQTRELEASFIYDTGCIAHLQHIFLDVAELGPSPATPALLAWVLLASDLVDLATYTAEERRQSIMFEPEAPRSRRESLTVDQSSAMERAAEVIKSSVSTGNALELMGKAAVDRSQAFEVITMLSNALQETLALGVDDMIQRSARSLLLSLLDRTDQILQYTTGFVASTIAVIVGSQRSWHTLDVHQISAITSALADAFTDANDLADRLKLEAQRRYPFELGPFLQFTKLSMQLAMIAEGRLFSTMYELQRLPGLTQRMPPTFQGYSLPLEDTDINLIKLDESLQLFRSRRGLNGSSYTSSALIRGSGHNEMAIPMDTQGHVISSDRPLVTLWDHDHSALQYLTNWLATLVTGCEWVETSTETGISLSNASEIISTFATLIQVSSKGIREVDDAQLTSSIMLERLESLRDGFRPDRDLINIVFDIFEQQLESHSLHPGADGSIDVLINCALFMVGSTELCPGRVWSFLSRSQLLDLDGGGGCLVTIVEATEMVSGKYDMVIACTRLFEALVEEAVRSVVARRATKTSTRFGNDLFSDATPNQTIGNILLVFTKTLTGLFGSSLDWRFATSEDHFELNMSILRAFGKFLSYTYDFDDSSILTNRQDRLTAVLKSSAEYIIDVFLTTSASDLITRPLLQILSNTSSLPYDRLAVPQHRSWTNQLQSALRFLVLLFRINSLLKLPKPALESRLFEMTAVNTRLFAAFPPCREDILNLLTEIIKSATTSDKEPPSLLGNIGADAAKSFIALLMDMTQSNDSVQAQIAAWNLLAAVVSSRQQWFAIYILTGTSPRAGLKDSTAFTNSKGKTLFQIALHRSSDLSRLEPGLAVAILRFIESSQNYWPRVIREVRKHPSFIDGILAYLGTLKRNERERDSDKLIQSCYETRIASIIAGILAMCLHFARQLGDIAVAEKVAPKLSFFKEFGVTAPRYNTSLHTNLEKNLEAKYPGCKLRNFMRASHTPSEFGENFYYGLEFATKVLNFDPHWSKEQSIRREFPLANIDLSVVEAQMELINSWKLLATELGNVCDRVQRLQPLLITVTQKCLEGLALTDNPPFIIERIAQGRADFAFVLLQKLMRASVPPSEMKELFGFAWTAIRGIDFETAFTGDNAEYHQALLKILFLALKPHLGSHPTSQSTQKVEQPKIASSLLEMLERVIVRGFRALATQLHEDPDSVNPGDFVLITALLQSILRVKDIASLHSQIVLIFTNNNVTRYAASLFSWADQLAFDSSKNGSGDPIYGELSISFLLELSTVPLMAEAMAVESILAQLSAATLCQYCQRGQGMGPFDEPVRLFAIWSTGMLPLALNLLDAIGAPIAAEIATFLNQFQPQMARNAQSLESRSLPASRRGAAPIPGAITLSLANETHTLALISYGLNHAREAGAAAGVVSSEIPALEWDAESVKEDLQAWVIGRKGLADRIVATSEAEEALMRTEPVADKMSDNRLEERIVAEFHGVLRCLGVENGDAK